MLADEATQKKIVNRLKRAQGQLNAVLAFVEAGGDCKTVVTQLAAVSSALDKAGFQIIATAMKDCLVESPAEARTADGVSMEELERLFLSLS